MDNKKIKELAEEIIKLEEESQNGINVENNMIKMNKIFTSIPLGDSFKLISMIEEKIY